LGFFVKIFSGVAFSPTGRLKEPGHSQGAALATALRYTLAGQLHMENNMHQILVYGNEQYEQSILLANVSAQADSVDKDGLLTKTAREQVLRYAANLPRAEGFDRFELQYLAPGASMLREERWRFTPPEDDNCEVVELADGSQLFRHYSLTEDIPHIEV
jgi:hypothetical protein